MSISLLLEPDKRWMDAALRLAQTAFEAGEVPVGAIVVRDGAIVGRGYNMVESLGDPTAHAEMIAITAACETIGSKFLEGCTLYVTLEPCVMCAGASVLARVPRLVFGALDPKSGAASSVYNVVADGKLNHRIEVVSGIEEDRASALLKEFFARKRVADLPSN